MGNRLETLDGSATLHGAPSAPLQAFGERNASLAQANTACIVSIHASAVPTLMIDREGCFPVLDCNEPAERLLGRHRADLIGRDVRVLLTADPAGSGPARSAPQASRSVYTRPDGSTLRLIRTDTPAHFQGRHAWLTTLLDVTNPDRADAEMQRERHFLERVVQALPAAVFVKDLQDGGRYVLCTRTMEDMANLPPNSVLGKRDSDLFPAESVKAFTRADNFVLETGDMAVSEATVYRDGAMVVTETRRLLIATDDPAPRYVLGIAQDMTQRREMEYRLARVAMRDALTGLANRTMFRERLRAALRLRQRCGGFVVLHCLDLDKFKGVNDMLGHAAGDLLLAEVGARIEAACGAADTAARLGGDEFAIVQGPIENMAEASDLAARVARSLSLPIDIGGKTLVIGSSAGLAVAPQHGDDPDILARSADAALYGAKARERGTYRFFDAELAAEIQARHQLQEDIREALAKAEFELFYQPVVDIASNRIVSFEALLRWQHPTRGLVLPSEIIPVAEESGLIVQLGDWVVREACLQATAWPDSIGVSVNFSSVQFHHQGLAASVERALAQSGLAPGRLEIEITESVLLANNESNLSTLHTLRDHGIRVSLDDFGIGYSSLGYLSAFPFDKIKIHRSFIRNLGAGRTCHAIVRSVIKLADDLGIATTAVGVETREQLERLRRDGCTEAQGHFFEEPQAGQALPAILDRFAGQFAAH